MKRFSRKKISLGKKTGTVIEEGRHRKLENITVFYAPADEKRLSVVIGRKVGKSVTRNRLRRWTKEFFMKEMEKISKYYIVVNYKKGSGSYKLEDIEEKVKKLWEECGIYG
ncbi:MAG: ribonuclease P protein component [Elusimicrobia bacterium]|nr:ribonuclease P protein component [Elusimicrobiota bacterium]